MAARTRPRPGARLGSRLLVVLVALGATLPVAAPVTTAAAATTPKQITVDCTVDTSCDLEWDAVSKPVSVWAGPSPDAIDWKDPVADVAARAPGTTVTGLDPTARTSFAVGPSRRAATIAADRSLHFTSAPNFRDLGGYQTSDGRRVQWGKVYRADSLHALTDADYERLTALDVKVVCDFRGSAEVASDGPDRLPPGAELVSLPVIDESNDLNAAIRAAILSGDRAQQEAVFANGKVERILVDGGRFLATGDIAREQFGAMLERLAEPDALPTVLHCTAGKDRTGWASAVVLTLLGVPRKTVFADYYATNEYTRSINEARIDQVRALLYDPELLRPLLEVRPEYLQASFDAVEEEYGSFQRYLTKGLGIDKRTQQQIKQNLLTD